MIPFCKKTISGGMGCGVTAALHALIPKLHPAVPRGLG
jgi:hypothetical protein